MHTFDYSFLLDGKISVGLLDSIENIIERKTFEALRQKKFAETFEALEQIAIINSVVASNEIEGIRTTEERAIEIVKHHAKPQTHSEEEIAGYRDALKLIHENHDKLELSEETILTLHAEICKYTDVRGGIYKQKNNGVYSFDQWGNRRAEFIALPAAETPYAVKALADSYHFADMEGANSLLLIPCFILDFLCIHPFTDGNGRVSRLLSLLLLYKNGYNVGKYISFEGQIKKRLPFYYANLKASSDTWHTEYVDYTPFVKDFLVTLNSCYNELSDKFIGVAEERQTKKERIRLMVMGAPLPLSKSELTKRLPDISVDTITKALKELLAKNLIEKTGGGRNTKYKKKHFDSHDI